MANEHWYGLKVRSGFATIAAQKLRKLNLEVFVPEQKSITTDQTQTHNFVYCRFELANRQAITSIPGVIDIIGSPEPKRFDGDMPAFQSAPRLR